MALTILERPEGRILETTSNAATVSESYGAGDAQFVSPTVHGLVDGDFIYAESVIENYAGFWYVDAVSTGIFKIKRYASGDYVQFIADGSITWYKSSLSHGWSAVHLPITYRISNNLFPVNSSDTTRNINSVQDDNGFTVILLSGSLGSGVNTYDFVKMTLPADTELSGVYQILEFISPTVMIINLAYDSSNNFTSATALKHYNNYNVLVRVYAGINASHEWTAQKPYELAATLELIPDENNEVFFSINDILQSYVETSNNLLLGTLPNNVDAWANFYIETAESYDDSDGYTFGTNTGNYTSDLSNFEGTAVNAKLEFKNLYSGYLSAYLMTNNTAKFLTLFTIPVLFSCSDDTPDCYSDISFINPTNGNGLILKKEFYLNGSLQTTENENLGILDAGVIRAELEADCSYDRVDITLSGFTSWESQASAADNQWTAVTYSPELDLFVAVAQTGTGDRVMTSPDGETWTLRTSAADNQWRSVCWSPTLNLFVAVSQNGASRVMTSPDGITWTSRTAAEANSWQDVIWVEDDSQFIAVSQDGVNRAMTSPDGITWSVVAGIGAQTWQSITYANGLYVTVAGSGLSSESVATSPDAVTWTYRTAVATGWSEVVHTGTRFVSVGTTGVMYSDDGFTWLAGAESSDHHWTGLEYSGGILIAVSTEGESMVSSDDGSTWEDMTSATQNQWASVAADTDNLFVAVSINGSGDRVMTTSFGEISETKRFDIDCGCSNQEIRLTWLNNLGGFDYWAFTAQKDHVVEIQQALEAKKNIFPQWPNSYGATADTIRKQTFRVSNKAYTIRSQFVGEDQVDALAYIKSSILVQIINSRVNRRTVIVDTDSFVIRKDGDKTHSITFNISFTDDIPVQTA